MPLTQAAGADRKAPREPSNLRLTAATDSSISLAWDASKDNKGGAEFAGYGLYRDRDRIFVAKTTETTYTFTALNCGTTEVFGVDAFDNEGNRSQVTTVTASTAPCPAPPVTPPTSSPPPVNTSPPTSPTLSVAPLPQASRSDRKAPSEPSNLRLTAATDSSISLAWNASKDNKGGAEFAGYGLYRDRVLVAKTTETTYTFTALSCGTTAVFGVDAFDNAGNRSQVTTVTASTAPCPATPPVTPPDSSPPPADTSPPTSPTQLRATASAATTISVSWTASTDGVGVAGYAVYKNGSRIATTPETTYTFGGLVCGMSYTLAVDAYDAAGNRSPQATLIAATNPCPDSLAPSAPGNLTVTGTTTTSVSLFWSLSFDNVAVTGYDLLRNGSKVGSTAGTNYTFSGLTCGTSYTLAVQAYDAAGNRSLAATVSSATAPCTDTQAPSTPGNLLSTGASATSLSLSWSPSTDNVAVAGYGVYVNGGKVASVVTPAYTFSGLSCGTSYDFAVDAYDAAGNRSAKGPYVASTLACATAPPTEIKYRFAYSNRGDQNLMPSYGYNLIDVATKSEADATPAGAQGQVWLYDYDNTTCGWEKDDAYIRNMVSSMANDPKVAGFYFANESDPIACPNAIQQHRDRHALIKSLAPNKYTILAVDSNWRDHFSTQVPMWKGVADYLVYNPYICYVGKPCDFAWLDTVIKAANTNGNPYFIALQAFAEGNEWRWPTASEEKQMLDRLKTSNASGYMTFSWNWNNDPLLNHPDVLQAIKEFNLGTSPPADTTPPPSDTTPPPSDTTPPSTPTNLAVTGATSSSISVSWTNASDNLGVSGYSVWRDATFVATVAATSYTLTGLSCGMTYTLRVEAFDAAGNHSVPASLSAATSACSDTTPPTTPGSLRTTNTSATTIAVAWTASSDNVAVSGYGLYRNGASIGETGSTSYTYTGLACGTGYTLAVDASDAAGNRSGKATLTASTTACAGDTTPPSTPTGVTQTSSTQTSLSLSWTPSSDNVGVTGYSVYRGANLDGTSGSASYTANGLACGSSYAFTVEARDAAGNVSPRSGSITATTAACPSGSDPVVTAAGDICASSTDCDPTADLIQAINPARALTLGDNAYPDGTLSQFNSFYEPNWGRFKAKTSPTPGNHDYHLAGASGYFSYFGSLASAEYYSYDVGSWHLISLNSEISVSSSSAQLNWLRNDLAAHPNRCTLAYWHRPRFSSGTVHGGSSSYAPFWDALYAAKADIVLTGHEHNYERFAKQNPSGAADATNGIREFVVGTGGASHGYPFGTPVANSEVRNDNTWGVLKLTLHPTSYDWQFVPIAGSSFTDSGSSNCS